jgi:glyoxylase-like metal-dependent hydrolase (beta-lactamase superfamily II)
MTEPPSAVEPAASSALGPWREVRSGVFVAVAEPQSVNLGLVVGSQWTLLVDSGSSLAQSRMLRASVAAVTGRPLRAVVVTHWHNGRSFAPDAFADVPRIAHESLHLKLSSADVEIAVATALDLGDRRVEIAHLGRGHTDGDLVIVVPDADVLFAGGLLDSSRLPSFGPDSVPDEWPATLDAVIGLMTASTLAIPGHGEPVDREFVFQQRSRIAAQAAEKRMPPGSTLPLV